MADSSAVPAWVAALIAFGGAVFSGYLGALMALKGQREARDDARKDRAEEEARAFQRTTLCKLQDVVLEVQRRTVTELHDQLLRYSMADGTTNGDWIKAKVGGDHQMGVRRADASGRLSVLCDRVASDQLRDLLRQVNEEAQQVLSESSAGSAFEKEKGFRSTVAKAQKALGVTLRSLYLGRND